MTQTELKTIIKKIQNHCGLEDPSKVTYFWNDEGKVVFKVFFDSLYLPEDLRVNDSERIPNLFSQQNVYEFEDEFKLKTLNKDQGFVEFIPDDQNFKVVNSYKDSSKKETKKEEEMVHLAGRRLNEDYAKVRGFLLQEEDAPEEINTEQEVLDKTSKTDKPEENKKPKEDKEELKDTSVYFVYMDSPNPNTVQEELEFIKKDTSGSGEKKIIFLWPDWKPNYRCDVSTAGAKDNAHMLSLYNTAWNTSIEEMENTDDNHRNCYSIIEKGIADKMKVLLASEKKVSVFANDPEGVEKVLTAMGLTWAIDLIKNHKFTKLEIKGQTDKKKNWETAIATADGAIQKYLSVMNKLGKKAAEAKKRGNDVEKLLSKTCGKDNWDKAGKLVTEHLGTIKKPAEVNAAQKLILAAGFSLLQYISGTIAPADEAQIKPVDLNVHPIDMRGIETEWKNAKNAYADMLLRADTETYEKTSSDEGSTSGFFASAGKDKTGINAAVKDVKTKESKPTASNSYAAFPLNFLVYMIAQQNTELESIIQTLKI